MDSHVLPGREFSPAQAWLLAGLTVGIMDLTDAVVFFGFRGAAPTIILQSIASGLLGEQAFSGGGWVSVLGVVCHFTIAFSIAAVFMVAARRMPALRQKPFLVGPAYGLLVYAIMYLIVIPISAAASRMPPTPVLINGLLIHMVGVGFPCAWFASRVRFTMDQIHKPSPHAP